MLPELFAICISFLTLEEVYDRKEKGELTSNDIYIYLNQTTHEYSIYVAIEKGYLEYIQHKYNSGCIEREHVKYAARIGQLPITKFFFYQEDISEPHYLVLEQAAWEGQLDIVKFYHSVGVEIDNRIMDFASGNGHLAVAKFCHSMGAQGTVRGLILAAFNGYLDIVKYLCSIGIRGSEEDIDDAIYNARENEHDHVCAYLEQNYRNLIVE